MLRRRNDSIDIKKISKYPLTFLEKRVIMHAEQEKDPQNQLQLIMRVPSFDLKCSKILYCAMRGLSTKSCYF